MSRSPITTFRRHSASIQFLLPDLRGDDDDDDVVFLEQILPSGDFYSTITLG
jgi:hypothetical protein